MWKHLYLCAGFSEGIVSALDYEETKNGQLDMEHHIFCTYFASRNPQQGTA